MPLNADAVWAPGPCLVRTEPTRRPHRCGRHPALAAQLRCAGLSLSPLPPRMGPGGGSLWAAAAPAVAQKAQQAAV